MIGSRYVKRHFSFSSDSVEAIFFGKTLGDVKVEKVIGDMCKVKFEF